MTQVVRSEFVSKYSPTAERKGASLHPDTDKHLASLHSLAQARTEGLVSARILQSKAALRDAAGFSDEQLARWTLGRLSGAPLESVRKEMSDHLYDVDRRREDELRAQKKRH